MIQQWNGYFCNLCHGFSGKELAPIIANGQLVPLVSSLISYSPKIEPDLKLNSVTHWRQQCLIWWKRQCWRVCPPQRWKLSVFSFSQCWSSWSQGFLIDGYPRDVAQGEEFEKTISPCRQVVGHYHHTVKSQDFDYIGHLSMWTLDRWAIIQLPMSSRNLVRFKL